MKSTDKKEEGGRGESPSRKHMFYTTEEAAQYLTDRGYRAKRGRTAGEPISADMVKRMCYAEKFPGAVHKHGPGRGYWLIPEADLDAFLATRSPVPAPSN